MNLSDFSYEIPQNLIAQKPTLPRDHCRLLVVDKNSDKLQHLKFFNIDKFLKAGDIVILNESKVIPAKLFGKKETGGEIEMLLIKKISTDSWEAMIKNFKIKEIGKKIILAKDFIAEPIQSLENGIWIVKFNQKGTQLEKTIFKKGATPLPPYITNQSKLNSYQTVYAKNSGSIASPTAGLHFTKSLIKKLEKKGIIFKTITLHVGIGTFSPIREENIDLHKMHSEMTIISKDTAKAVNRAKKEGRRIVAVGTTSIRALEAFADQGTNQILSGKKEVDIFIKPGYKFKIVDSVITNFHLSNTTLIILISAFMGREKTLRAYQEAINKKYKFFSYGDAMLIL